jgi:hypothetical protein
MIAVRVQQDNLSPRRILWGGAPKDRSSVL